MLFALLRKARADLKANRLQNSLIFLILALAAVALTVSLVVLRSADDPWMRTHNAANGAHIWLVAPYEGTDYSVLDAQPEVSQSTGDIYALASNPLVIGEDKLNVFLYGMDEPTLVAKPLLADGRWIRPGTADEIVLDFSFATYYEINVGDQVGVLTDEGVREMTVVGTAVSTHWITYQENTKDLIGGIGYISEDNVQAIQPDTSQWRKLYGIRLHDANSSTDYVPRVYELMNNRIESSIEWQWLRDVNGLTNRVVVLFMSFFSLLGLVSVGFIIGNAIGGQMLAQYREIGMMKAIGLRPRNVLTLLLLENLIIGIAAAALGISIGLAIGPSFASPMAELLNTTPTAVYDPVIVLTALVMILGAVVLFTIFPAWRASRTDTIRALTIGQQKQSNTRSYLAGMARRLGFPISVVVGVKDSFARPFRTWSSVLGLCMTVTLIVFSVGASATIDELSANPMFFQSTPADIKLNRSFVSDTQTRAIFAQHEEIMTFYSFHENFAWAEGYEDKPILIEALADDWEAFDFRVDSGRMFRENGEAIAGYGLKNTLDLSVGDNVTVIRDGEPLTVQVVGFVAEQYGLGHTLRMSLETYQAQIDPNAPTQYYGLALAAGTDREALAQALTAESNNQFRIVITSSDPNPVTVQLRNTALSLSMLLLLIAVVNLLSMSLLSVRERMRDFGIQKAIGFTPRQISQSVLSQVGVIVCVAIIVGLPFGLLIFELVMSNIGVQTGSGTNFGAMNYPTLFITVPLLMVLVALAGSYLPARRATRVQVAEALRYE